MVGLTVRGPVALFDVAGQMMVAEVLLHILGVAEVLSHVGVAGQMIVAEVLLTFLGVEGQMVVAEVLLVLELVPTEAAGVQVQVHVPLQLLAAPQHLKADVADHLAGGQMRDQVAQMVLLAVGALAAAGADIAGHATVHVEVQPQEAFPQEVLAADVTGELLLAGVCGMVLPQVAPLEEGLTAQLADVLAMGIA